MREIRLDLSIYPMPVIEQGITAYHALADISLRRSQNVVVLLEIVSRGQYGEDQVVGEFLNYLIGLVVKSQLAA